jgi:glycerate dehydrogenase
VTPLQSGVFLDLESIDNGDLDLSVLRLAVPQWTFHAHSMPGDLAGRMRDAEVVLVNKCVIGSACLREADSLKLIALCATGTDNVDLEAAAERGIAVCNIRDYCSDSLAQHVIALVLNLLTGQPAYLERVRAGEWSRARQFSLHDRVIRQANELTLGIVGYGALGQATARLAEALGMTVQVAERRGQDSRPGRVPFEALLQQADVISLHCPLTEDTRGMIGGAELAMMKRDALLINTARGGLLDDAALAAALRAGEIGGAAVDTLNCEPPPGDHPLLAPGIPNLLVTPHNAWASRSARQAAVEQLARVIDAFNAGQPINRVN